MKVVRGGEGGVWHSSRTGKIEGHGSHVPGWGRYGHYFDTGGMADALENV